MSQADSQIAAQQGGIRVPEGAFRPTRTEFIPEDYAGYTPSDFVALPISDGIRNFNPGYGHSLSEDAFLGNCDYRRQVQSETAEPEITSAMQQWLYDTDGNRQSLASFGFDRIGNYLPPSVTLVRRQEAGNSELSMHPASTANARYNPNAAINGVDSTPKHSRIYDVIKGFQVNEPTLTAENGNSTVDEEVSGMAVRGRMYHIDQPQADSSLVAFITDPSSDEGDGSGSNTDDTNLQVVIEGGDGGPDTAPTSETIAIDPDDATTPVATTTQFGPSTNGIDAIEVQDAETGLAVDGENSTMLGNCIVALNGGTDTPAIGEWLAPLWGAATQGGARPNEGVPPVGAGSHAGSISGDQAAEYYRPADIGVQRPIGANIAVASGVIQTMELSAENNIEPVLGDGRQQNLYPGMRGLEFTVSFSGETVTPHLQTVALTESDETSRILFGLRGDEFIDLMRAELEETDAEDEGGEPVTQREATFRPQIAADGGSAIEISPASGA